MMKGIANPQLKAGGLQIRRNENGKNECRQSLAAFIIFTKDLCQICFLYTTPSPKPQHPRWPRRCRAVRKREHQRCRRKRSRDAS